MVKVALKNYWIEFCGQMKVPSDMQNGQGVRHAGKGEAYDTKHVGTFNPGGRSHDLSCISTAGQHTLRKRKRKVGEMQQAESVATIVPISGNPLF